MGRKESGRGGGGEEESRENLREWNSRDGGRTEMRARKEIVGLRETLWG